MDREFFTASTARVAEALARAVGHWKSRREARALPPFTIALDGEAGANAGAVARAIGDRLGWQVYDHELVEGIARDMGVRADLLDSVDEKRMGWLQELCQGLFVGRPVSDTTFAHHLGQTLLALAAHGECVLVGRGAAQVLPPETTLRVRLVGPRKGRIAEVRRRFGYSFEEAARWVDQTDRERKAFVKEHFRRDLTDPEQYDLVLNAIRYPPAQCAEIAAASLHLLEGRTAPTGAS
jgi:cytidylate kinase